MRLTANKRIRMIPNIALRVRRQLEGKGKLAVLQGEEVTPSDVLGKYEIALGFASFNLANTLGVSAGRAREYLVKQMGNRVYKNELIAEKKGFFGNRSMIAPTDGILEQYDPITGMLRMRYLPKEGTLASGVYGIVEEVNHQAGEVIIKTMATEIYGVYGSGVERFGSVHVLDGKGNLVLEGQLKAEYKGTIIVGGALVYSKTLQKALSLKISGIISGGFNSRDFRSITGLIEPAKQIGTDIGTSVLATEGFGAIPMGDDIFKVIVKYEGKSIFLNGNTARILLPALDSDSIIALKKIALPNKRLPEHRPELTIEDISLGSRVRIIWPPFMGVQGKVLGIDESPTVLPSGISTYLLTVETPTRKVKIPYPNIELI